MAEQLGSLARTHTCGGLRPGDVILEINRQSVKNAEDAIRLTENPKDKTTLLRIWSNGGTRYLVVDEENKG